MKAQTLGHRTIRTVVCSFLGLTGVAIAMTAAKGMGVIDAAVTKRSVGLVVGAMAIVIGNFLPKIRPLHVSVLDHVEAAAAERLAGWVLVLTGIANVTMFAFAQLDQARRASGFIGIAAIAMIAVDWTWLLSGALVHCRHITRDAVDARGQSGGQRTLVVMLLFAFFWVLATANVKFLFEDMPWFNQLASWMTVGFCFIQAALTVALDRSRSPR